MNYKNKMKILLVSFYYTPELGAAPYRITSMAEGLKKEGAEVDVLTCLPNYPKGRIFEGYRGRLYQKEEINGIWVYRYWAFASVSKNPILRTWGMVSFALTMWLFALKVRLIRSYDRVIIQSPPIFVAFSAMLLFKCVFRKKTVLNVSDLWPLSAIELGAMKNGSWIHRALLQIEKFLYQHADGYLGQSNEILRHISEQVQKQVKKQFLYRNLKLHQPSLKPKEKKNTFRIVYAGLLGVSQNILGILEHVDFKALGAELHLYGGGNQTVLIEEFLKNKDTNVYYHGFIAPEKLAEELQEYDVSLIPLAVQIKGAVPSKIFDVLPVGLPILFCGGGEGAHIIENFRIGYVAAPGDYEMLRDNIQRMLRMTEKEYQEMSENCQKAATSDFSFSKQIQACYCFLKEL